MNVFLERDVEHGKMTIHIYKVK